MKNCWTVIETLDTDFRSGLELIKVLENKFPDVKFKLGKVRPSNDNYLQYPTMTVPIMAYLPTPSQPNDLSVQVCCMLAICEKYLLG